ncbi:MAG: insulinase family protein [Gammaproteobacteria bacterium]|nr:insulinase family protein [Gammaproteobacteria bacterium]MDH5802400.1 insulinase family protein [Gammaproteobacteria bacterium]
MENQTALKPADTHPAFQWRRSETIASLNVTVEEYEHKQTGARHYHVAADNSENVFLVGLKTVPTDSTGVAHILEHTALCGSKNYPVRDPFFMMIRRSLNTFMNAFTSSDWTAYPFASQNRKDYYNLLDVYLDAVFFSNLHELDFAQEGHRVEFAEPENPQSDLVYKGVVFNEMKGAMGSPVSLLWQNLTKHLFPSVTYHYNSGGDPADIPNLSYAELKAFYQTHYHPSNAVFLTFGDIPAVELQQRFEDRVLSQFQRSDKTIEVPLEKRYSAPITVEETYQADDNDPQPNKTHVVTGWLLGESIDLKSKLKAQILSGILMDNSASPLLKALETSPLGSAPSPLCGVEDSNREMTFMCGLEGAKTEDAAAIEAMILDVLEQVALDGVPQEQLESVLHQLELEQREITGGSYPYGLQIILDALPTAIHNGDPVASLNLDPVLEQLHQDIKQANYAQNLVKDMLLNNPHRVRLSMIPDPKHDERAQQEERNKLAQLKSSLSETHVKKILQQTQDLLARQAQTEDADILPKVELSDIPASMHIAQGSQVADLPFPVHYYPQPTNGLVYQQAVIPLPNLDEELLEILPYYSYCLTELGCGDMDYLQTQALQARVSGGISAFSNIRSHVDNVQETSGYFFVSGKALSSNNPAFSQLLYDTLENARFDELGRVRELISQLRASREQGVMRNGHGLAMSAATSGLCAASALKHRLSGVASIQHIKSLDESLKQDNALQAFAAKLEALHQRIKSSSLQFLLVGETEQEATMLKTLNALWQDDAIRYGHKQGSLLQLAPVEEKVKQAWLTNAPVSFCAKAYKTVTMSHADAPALAVLAGFLRNGYLHRSIREQGGAYGGGASFLAENAAFRFYSYRDPRLEETLDDFDRSIEWLLKEKHQQQPLEEAILGVISGIDKPSSPAGEAKDAFTNLLFGRTAEQRQAYRSKILDVTIADLQRVGQTYFDPQTASVAVISNHSNAEVLERMGLEKHLI